MSDDKEIMYHHHSNISAPPTFYNSKGTTRPFYLFPLFLLINIITMADRAIIPGASREFLAFLGSARDSPQVVKDNPDAGLVRNKLPLSIIITQCCVLFANIVYYTPCYTHTSFIHQKSSPFKHLSHSLSLSLSQLNKTGHSPSSLHGRIYNLHNLQWTLRSQNQMETTRLLRFMHMVVGRSW